MSRRREPEPQTRIGICCGEDCGAYGLLFKIVGICRYRCSECYRKETGAPACVPGIAPLAAKGSEMNDSIEDLVDAFEVAVKDAAYSDCSPMGDPGNYYKHMERDEARKALMAAITRAALELQS